MKQSHNFCAGSLKKWTSVFMLIVFALVVGIGAPVVSFAAEEESSPSNEAALGVGSFFLTLVYTPVKMAYAILGGVVGGFTYALTGGNVETAQNVWEPSVYGTYIITPDHLKGNEPVRFVGVSAYEEEAYLTERVD
jgi:4-hydroxybenzoate polyprenyltransferase